MTPPLKSPVSVIRARPPDGGGAQAMEISAPEADAAAPNFWCTVRLPGIFEDDKRIAGVDGAQARALARAFALEMLAHHGYQVVGDDG